MAFASTGRFGPRSIHRRRLLAVALTAISVWLTPAAIVVAQPALVPRPELAGERWVIRTQVAPELLELDDEARDTFDASIFIEQSSELGDLRSLEVLRWPDGALPTPDVAGSNAPGTDAVAAPVQAVNIGEWVVLPDLRMDEWAILSAPTATVQPIALELPEVKYYAPDRLFFVDESSADGGDPVLREARLFFGIESVPLPWLPEERAYGDNLIVGLDPVEPEAMGHPMPKYVVRLTTEGARISGRTTLTFDALGQEARVPLRADDHRGPIAATAHMNNKKQRLDLSVVPRLAGLGLTVTSSTSLGLGLQPIAFTVQRYAEDGQPLSAEQDVVLRATGNGVLFDGDGLLRIERGASSVQGRLRSVGLAGATSFSVVEGSVRSDPVDLRFVFPWLIMLIAAIGGALGATVHRGFRRVEGPIVRDAATGMLVGVLAVAAIIVGVPAFGVGIALTSVILTGAGTFVAAAIAGYGGRHVLELLLAAVYGSRPPATPA